MAYYAFKQGADLPRDAISQALRGKLPPYMVPAYLEELPSIPMTLSNKADHKKLPKPRVPRFSAGTGYVPPKTESERVLSAALCDLLRTERVSTEHHFFDDLGANSLMMARFCAAIRKNSGMSSLSMRDIYTNPTIARLGAHLDASVAGIVASAPEPFHVPSNLSYYACGAMQLAFYAAYALFGLWVLDAGYTWATAADGALALYARSVVFAAGSFVALTAISIVAKWALIGRFKAQSIPIWSFAYFRFWVVMTMMRTTPVTAFTGTPIYNIYLRLMGARIGRNAVIAQPPRPGLRRPRDHRRQYDPAQGLHPARLSRAVELHPHRSGRDRQQRLRRRGERARYRHRDGRRHAARPCLVAAERAARAGRQALPRLACGRDDLGLLPDREPRRRRRCAARSMRRSSSRRCSWSRVPLPILGYHLWDQYSAASGASLVAGTSTLSLLGISAAWFFGAMVFALAAIYAIPRLCMLFLKEGVTYPTFGFHYLMQSIILRVSNSQFFCVLFGDSSFIVNYMRYVGWTLNKVEQTGSNMGTNQRHDNPFLSNIGSGTMVSDGLSMINMEMSATSFRLAESKIGENNYLGNDIFYPPNGRTGANVLLGTKTMIPIDGPVRENVGLLGSPAFEIPRMVDRDRDMNAAIDEATRRARLRQKNRYNAVTAVLFLLSRWMSVFAALVLWSAALANYDRFGVFALFAATVAITAGSIAFFVLLERASLAFKRLEPKLASIYDPYFWFHERHWKLSESPVTGLFSGTPFRAVRCSARWA